MLAAVEAALRGAYSFDARAFDEPVFRSEIVAIAHSVAGVLGVDVDRLYKGTTAGLADRLLAQRRPGGVDAAAGDAPIDGWSVRDGSTRATVRRAGGR